MEREAIIAALESLPQLERINVARLQPSDVVVVELEGKITSEAAEFIKRTLREVFPKNKVLVCDEGTRLRVVSAEEAEASAEGTVV